MRCRMVTIIGLVTIVALVWLLAWAMGLESDSERRRRKSASSAEALTHNNLAAERQTRRAA
ncbi:exported protein of unknown function [Nitrospira defluvii]|uniref:Uncharacterized protein n=1 Tax=Nitrospira defluvii TaxID=330214 RepID=D8PHT7_9BACT|nr:exported protein of unknown function [Nitrospira defluvii]